MKQPLQTHEQHSNQLEGWSTSPLRKENCVFFFILEKRGLQGDLIAAFST